VLLLLLLVLALPRLAFAQGDNVSEARDAEERARKAFQAGEYEEAAAAFAKAFSLAPKAATKYNEAFAWNEANRPAPAADAYEAALEVGGLETKLQDASTERLSKLKTQLGRLVVKAPLGATISVAHVTERTIPTKIYLQPGKHAVTVQLGDGSTHDEVVVIEAGATKDMSFDVAEPRAMPDPEPDEPLPEESAGTMIAGWTLVGVGAAAFIGMGVTGALTQSAVSDYDDGGNVDAGLRDKAVTLKTTTNVLLGVGAGFVATGVLLLLIDALADDVQETALRVTPDGVQLRW
jgi:hypothetical protein